MTEREVNSLWPMLDIDQSGEIGLEEFIRMVKSSDRRASCYEDWREYQHRLAHDKHKSMREYRIRAKTGLAEILTHKLLHLRAGVVDLERKGTDVFGLIDIDSGGSIDVGEFIDVIQTIDFSDGTSGGGQFDDVVDVSPETVKYIWPALVGSEEVGAQLTKQIWDAFTRSESVSVSEGGLGSSSSSSSSSTLSKSARMFRQEVLEDYFIDNMPFTITKEVGQAGPA
jgi:hypothetical protein